MIKALGGYHVLTLLQGTTIPPNAFIFILTCRLGNVTISETNTELHGKLVAVIENITSARDKVVSYDIFIRFRYIYLLIVVVIQVAAIRDLHKIKKENPNLDINLYLHKISSAFRRFVLVHTLIIHTYIQGTEQMTTYIHAYIITGYPIEVGLGV